MPDQTLCTCGHPHDAHTHYRPGTDCGLCACQQFTRPRRLAEYIDSTVAWNLLLFGHLAQRGHETPLPPARRLHLSRLMARYDRDRVRGLLPWQRREAARFRASTTPIEAVPAQRSRSASEAEDRLFNHWPGARRNNNGGRA